MSANLGDGAENWPLARDYDPSLDGARSYDLAVRASREHLVRKGVLIPRPRDAQELRWASEGPVPYDQLETVRNG